MGLKMKKQQVYGSFIPVFISGEALKNLQFKRLIA